MIKKITCVVALVSSITGISSAQAADNCLNISANVGTLAIANCGAVWNSLATSGKFPDIFPLSQQPKLYPGLCFVSTGNIPATLGKTLVNVSTVSAWTTEFAPALFGMGSDNLGSVITQWVVKDLGNKVLGNIYTRDSVDTSSFSELDVIIAGTGKLAGAKGAVRVDSRPGIDGNGQPTGLIDIVNISGSLCLSN